ncbi:MAG: flagellin [Lachnospiraceae bacterium]|nr:flagellin [Lachnospiraceae bacterium]
MSVRVNPNIQAMITNSVLQANERSFTKSSDKMTSGYKITSARDNPAGYALSAKMHSKLSNLEKANQNASNGINVVQTAEGALAEVQNMVQRMKELSVQAANGTNTTEDRDAIQMEVGQLLKEINRISGDTHYNTQGLLSGEQDLKGYAVNSKYVTVETYSPKLPTDKDYVLEFNADGTLNIDQTRAASDGFRTGSFDITEYLTEDNTTMNRITYTNRNGSQLVLDCEKNAIAAGTKSITLEINGIGGMKIQSGALEGQEINLAIPELSLKNMHLDSIDMRTEEGAKDAMAKLDYALSYVSDIRSKLGAWQNRLEETITSLAENQENLTAAYSNIKDVDMAEEMVEYTRLQVLTQAGVSMLTQANEAPQQALQLLQ